MLDFFNQEFNKAMFKLTIIAIILFTLYSIFNMLSLNNIIVNIYYNIAEFYLIGYLLINLLNYNENKQLNE